MKVKTAPTSPKYAIEQQAEAMADVWRKETEEIVQPVRWPWGRAFLQSIVISLVVVTVVLGGGQWWFSQHPQSWFARWWPHSETTTTIVANPTVKAAAGSTTIPEAVTKTAATLYGLAADQGPKGVYTPSQVLAQGIPLSNDGWLMTVDEAVPNADTHLTILPPLGTPGAPSATVHDPATAILFLKIKDTTAAPVTFQATAVKPFTPVWIVSQAVHSLSIVPRLVVNTVQPAWTSADQLDSWLVLDGPVTAPLGSAALNERGELVGILGANGQLWPVDQVNVIMKGLLQNAAIERAAAGFRYVNRADAIIQGQPTAQGLIVGSSGTDIAVAPKSPADRAGLKIGDVITAVDGQPIDGSFFSLLQRYHPGDQVTLTVQRLGDTKKLTLTVGALRS